MDLLQYDFLQRALIAAAVVGLVTPLIGVFLVQRRLALLGDGMGHVALAGVGLAFLFGTAPVPTALVAAACGAVIIELIRAKSRTAGDLALALIFYGGIAGGVLFTSLAGGRSSAARTQGIRTTATSMLLTVLAALAVVIGMRTVGLLLVSAIMIVPVAAAQQLSRSFRGTAALGVVVGELSAVLGLVASFQLDVPPGPAIVVLALLFFGAFAAVAVPLRRRRSRRVAAARPAVLHEEVAA